MLFSKNPSHRTGDNKKDSFSNPKILEVNLIKGEARVLFDWRKELLVLLVIFLIAGSLVAELYFGLDWWGREEMANAQLLSNQIDALNRDIAQIKGQTDAALTYQAKTAAVGQLLTNHIYWTKFLRWLEKDTLSSVKYAGFSGDLTGLYNLAANAPSYAEVSWQAKAFSDDPLVEKVEIISAGGVGKDAKAQSGINFPLSLQVKPDIFKK
jgi:hypothetical protein